MPGAVAWYDSNAETVAADYEAVRPEALHGWLGSLIPEPPAPVLDVGAGSGRDAAWFAARGHDVVAVEPAGRLRQLARQRHPEPRIRWSADSLPELAEISRSGLVFDLILLSAVWMHVPPRDRRRAFRKLVNLLRPGGVLALTLRRGPAERGRCMHPVSQAEIEKLARDHGVFVQRCRRAPDLCARRGVAWICIAVRAPADDTGALPLLRHVILNDSKSSTFKLALLRCLCRIADGAAGLARDRDDGFVAVPLGLVALTWLRLFGPLLAAGLPQNPQNIGDTHLGFVGEPFRRLAAQRVSHRDLRVGRIPVGRDLHCALRDAARTITKMPATYITHADGRPVFPVLRNRRLRWAEPVPLDQGYLAAFGEMLVPRHLWMAMQRHDAWIEPALVAEWQRLMQEYAGRQNRTIGAAAMNRAMVWDEPTRDVRAARQRAERLLDDGALQCVWTGRRLRKNRLDVDHCLPWRAWPCGDLWNLMPASRWVNQHGKRDLLPSDAALHAARGRITEWWDAAYVDAGGALDARFWLEARSSLPALSDDSRPGSLDGLFEALRMQRLRLKHDQQVPEWPGP